MTHAVLTTNNLQGNNITSNIEVVACKEWEEGMVAAAVGWQAFQQKMMMKVMRTWDMTNQILQLGNLTY